LAYIKRQTNNKLARRNEKVRVGFFVLEFLGSFRSKKETHAFLKPHGQNDEMKRELNEVVWYAHM